MGTGWNMPPGCTDADLPGNSPEDFEWDKWSTTDQLAEVIREYIEGLNDADVVDQFYERGIKGIEKAIEDAFQSHLEP